MLYIFDMGGVVTTTCKVEKQLEQVLGIDWKTFLSYCGINDESEIDRPGSVNLMSLCSDGKITCAEFWRIFSERSGIAVKTDWWHWLFHPVLNVETVKIINELKARGHRVVCGTNTIDSHWRNHMERGDYSFFDQTYSSCFMGVSKPDVNFWKLILLAENTDAGEAVFIDDKKVNCDAAASLGIRAFVFESAEKLRTDLGL